MTSDDENDEISTLPNIWEDEDMARNSILPTKSKHRYEKMYETFEKWQSLNETVSLFSENVLLEFFHQLSTTKSPPTLWSSYSMLKTMIRLQHNIDIGNYKNLLSFLKSQSKGYTSTKAKIFTDEEITKFINEAPDIVYLATKVALIFGVMGGCRTHELLNMCTNQIEIHGRMFLIKLPNTETLVARSFTISDECFDIVKKYKDLRPPHVKTQRFFLNYQKGKCSIQVIGKHKFEKMPQQIAEYLNLNEANRYTGHSFRRTSATIFANAGAKRSTIKRHSGWKPVALADDGICNKHKNSNLIKSCLNQPSTSTNLNSSSLNDDKNYNGMSSISLNPCIFPSSRAKSFITEQPCRDSIENSIADTEQNHIMVSYNNSPEPDSLGSSSSDYRIPTIEIKSEPVESSSFEFVGVANVPAKSEKEEFEKCNCKSMPLYQKIIEISLKFEDLKQRYDNKFQSVESKLDAIMQRLTEMSRFPTSSLINEETIRNEVMLRSCSTDSNVVLSATEISKPEQLNMLSSSTEPANEAAC